MSITATTYTSCPYCHGNINGIYSRFVNPADPINDCRHCGRGVNQPEKRMSFIVRTHDRRS